jgi:hypothetical protein
MDLIPGLLQGITRVLISYPFDYIRTNIQTQEYKSIFSYIYQKKLTVKDAYRGSSIQLVSVPIDRSIQFYLFEKISKNNSIFIASISSSILSSIYSVPINFLTTQLIVKHSALSFKNIHQFLKDKKHYTGFTADLSKSLIGSILYTSSYGYLRQLINKERHNYFLFGIIASISSWLVIYPLDTLRVIKQTTKYSYKEIIKTTTFKQYYSGFSIILMRSVPSAGAGMVVYEKSKQLLL